MTVRTCVHKFVLLCIRSFRLNYRWLKMVETKCKNPKGREHSTWSLKLFIGNRNKIIKTINHFKHQNNVPRKLPKSSVKKQQKPNIFITLASRREATLTAYDDVVSSADDEWKAFGDSSPFSRCAFMLFGGATINHAWWQVLTAVIKSRARRDVILA